MSGSYSEASSLSYMILTYCHELGVNGKHQKEKNFLFNPCVSKLPVYQYPLLKLYLQMIVDISICSMQSDYFDLLFINVYFDSYH